MSESFNRSTKPLTAGDAAHHAPYQDFKPPSLFRYNYPTLH